MTVIKCEAITANGQRCRMWSSVKRGDRRVCGRHRFTASLFIEREPADWGAETLTRRESVDLLTEVMTRMTASAASQIEAAVREADWLWRRRFGDRKVPR
jgi:hypothetical protein